MRSWRRGTDQTRKQLWIGGKSPEEALDKAIESLIGHVATGLLSLLTVGLLVSLVSGGFKYLIESHRVPGWLFVVGLGAVVILLVQVLALRRRIPKLSSKTPQYKEEP